MDGLQANYESEPIRESVIRRRRKWSALEKTRIVKEALRSGAVLQEVAQRHGLHPGLLTRWRTQHRATAKKAPRREARLLAVRLEPRARARARGAQPGHLGKSSASSGAIEVEFPAGWRLHIQGIVDAQTLRTVLQELSRP